MDIISILLELQECDDVVKNEDKELGYYKTDNNKITLNNKLNEIKEKIKISKSKIKESNNKIIHNELILENIKKSISEINDKLYSGEIIDCNTLINLQNEEKQLNEKYSKIESITLTLMEEADKNNEIIIELENRYEKLKTEFFKNEKDVLIKIENIKIKTQKYNDRRLQILKILNKDIVNIYNNLLSNKGKAVVEVNGTICSGCHMDIPLTIISKVRNSKNDLIFCDNCGRILYIKNTL